MIRWYIVTFFAGSGSYNFSILGSGGSSDDDKDRFVLGYKFRPCRVRIHNTNRWLLVYGTQVRELRLKEEKGVEEEFELDQAEMNYLEQEVKRITGEHSYL